MSTPLSTGCLLATCYILLATHAYARRQELFDVAKWLRTLFCCNDIVSSLKATWNISCDRTLSADPRLLQEMDAIRLHMFQSFMAWFCRLCGLYAIWQLSYYSITRLAIDSVAAWLLHALWIFLYSFCLLSASVGIKPSRRIINALQVCVTAFLASRSLSMTNNPYFFILSSTRLALRFLFGILSLDCRFAVLCNAVLSVSVCYAYSRNYEAFGQHHANLRPYHTCIFVVTELFCFAFIAFSLIYVENLMLAKTRASLDARDAFNAKMAVDRLLGVLTDADLRVGADLCILEPSRKLAHLLASGSAQPGADLQDRHIAQFISSEDRGRFHDFLTAADVHDHEANISAPASSISLRMQDASGRHFPVDMFRVSVSGLYEQSGHLFGIREFGARQIEDDMQRFDNRRNAVQKLDNSTDASSARSLSPPERNSSDNADDVAPTSPQGCAGAPLDLQGWLPGVHEARERRSNASSHSSCSSGTLPSSAGGCLGFRWIVQRLAELGNLVIKVDAFSEGWTMQKLEVAFDSAGGGESPKSAQMPKLSDWMPTTSWNELHAVGQSYVNAWYGGAACTFSQAMNPLQFVLNPEGSRILFAESLAMELPDAEDWEGDEDALPMTLKLNGLSVLHASARNKHRRQEKSRQGSRQLEKLPSIRENRTSTSSETLCEDQYSSEGN